MKKLFFVSLFIIKTAFCAQATIELDPITPPVETVIETVQPQSSTTTAQLTENLVPNKSCFSRLKKRFKILKRPLGLCCLGLAVVAPFVIATLVTDAINNQSTGTVTVPCIAPIIRLDALWDVNIQNCGKCRGAASPLGCQTNRASSAMYAEAQKITKKRCENGTVCINLYKNRQTSCNNSSIVFDSLDALLHDQCQ